VATAATRVATTALSSRVAATADPRRRRPARVSDVRSTGWTTDPPNHRSRPRQ
jgi:hypothetical protein